MRARWDWLLAGFVATVVCAGLFVPAASASRVSEKPVRASLRLVPLRRAQLGAPGLALSLARDSGAAPNLPVGTLNPLLWTSSLPTFFSLDSNFLKSEGWVGGYSLDYGDAFSGCSCVTEIRTSVQRFKTAAGAKKILAWFKQDDATVPRPSAELGFAVDARSLLKLPAVGTSRFAYLTTYTTVHAKPVQVVDERFTDGRYLLQVAVASGTSNGTPLALKLAKKLDKRLRLMRAGRLQGRAPKLPAKPTPGPPPGGPDLSTLALQPSDFQPAPTDIQRAYLLDPFALALSDYHVAHGPAGSYPSLGQEIQWYRTANEAAFRATYDLALSTTLWGTFTGGAPITYVNLDSIGQGDRAAILTLPYGNPTGATDYLAFITLSRGRATDVVEVESPSQIKPSDVQTLATSMATRLDTGLPG